MSGPENSESKGSPSLLPSKPGVDKTNSNRILANLEGRVDATRKGPPGAKRRGLAALVLLLICGTLGGVWIARERTASSQTSLVREQVAPASTASATLAASAAAPGAKATTLLADAGTQPSGASEPNTARIVSDPASDPDRVKDSSSPSASASTVAAPDAAMSKTIASASGPSSAAASAVLPGSASPAVAAVTRRHEAAAVKPAAKLARKPAPGSRQAVLAKAHHAPAHEQGKQQVARVEKARFATPPAHGKDSDVDLLAALVAHTRPGKRGSESSANSHEHISERISACSKLGFFAGERCRWSVCAGQWGKDSNCPATQAANSH